MSKSGEKKTAGKKKPAKKGKQKKEEPLEIKEGLPSGRVTEVKLSDIDMEDKEYQFRVSLKTSDLVKSIEQDGQQFPVILRGEKPYQIVSGFRRIEALNKLGAQKVKAIVREDLTDEDAFKVSFIENEKQKNLSTLDKAHAVEKLKEAGKKKEEIGQIFGLSEKQIGRYEEIAKFPDSLKKAISSGKILAKHALLINQYHNNFPRKIDIASWIKEASENGLSADELKKRLAKQVRGTKKSKRYYEKRKDGFRLFPMSFDPKKTEEEEKEKMAKALRSALEALEK